MRLTVPSCGWQPWISLLLFFWQIYRSGCRPENTKLFNQEKYTTPEGYVEKPDRKLLLDKWDLGKLHLLLSGVVDQVLDEVRNELEDVDRLSDIQTSRLRHKLKGLYAQLKDHPALLQRRLFVGSQKPDIHPPSMRKRGFGVDLEQPVCPSRTDWVRLKHARDINDTEVEVFQPPSGSKHGQQWFYTNSCTNNSLRLRRDCPGCCIGIAHDRFSSSCSQRKSVMWAFARRVNEVNFDWIPVHINSSCNCAIKPVDNLVNPWSLQ